MALVRGTQGYAEESQTLIARYESLSFAEVHRSILHLLPQPPSRVLDIGAGAGRDAGALAALGHRVLAVEPTEAFRSAGQRLHPSPLIEWLDDSLPELELTRARGERFDLVMLTAVWMHLDPDERRRAMPHVAGLVAPGGLMVMSIRRGPVPAGRRMFEVPTDETVELAAGAGLQCLLRDDRASRRPDQQAEGVSWTELAFRRP